MAQKRFNEEFRINNYTPKEDWKGIRPYFIEGMKPQIEKAKEKYIAHTEEVTIAQTRVVKFIPKDCEKEMSSKILVYFHGGCLTLPGDLLHIPAPVSYLTNLPILCVDYPLAPENPFPASHKSCLNVYKELLKTYKPEDIAFLGDSAGGNLAVSVALMAAEENLELPGAIIAYSPWCDTQGTSSTYETLGKTGLSKKLSPDCMYAARDAVFENEKDAKSPYACLVNADFSNKKFPPVMMTTGTRDLLRGETEELNKQLAKAQVITELFVDAWLWHNYQEEPETEESLRCARRSAEFLKKHLKIDVNKEIKL